MIAVVISTLNEEAAIADVLAAVPATIRGEETRTYVIDGGSSDATVEIAEDHGAEVIHQTYPGGKGAAVRQAFDEIDADIYVLLDGDGTYLPEEMEELVAPIMDGEADHVMGSRIEHREKGSIPRFNLLGNLFFNFVVRQVYGRDIQDMLTGYRALDEDVVERMELLRDGFGIETEMTLLTLDGDARLQEVPITYRCREGDSKLHPVRDGLRIMKTIVWMARDTRPMLFFSGLSAVFFAAALYPSALVVQEKLATGFVQHVTPAVLASLLYIMALQTFLFGMIADQQKNTRKRLERKLDG
ncbi:MAG: glycosyltransferase [Candidatus Nanohaloarchaea archaeon]|nr:glycosyltransferase [Candidatus Nanohaloarchaea archaeon]